MKKLVIDTSVIVKWVNRQNEERLTQADTILRDVMKGSALLITPELAKYEIGNALLIKKKLLTDDAITTLNNLLMIPIEYVALSKNLAIETFRVAQMLDITYYDACFIALAHQENAILVTDNPKHQAKTQEVSVIALANY